MDYIWSHGPSTSEACREALASSRPMKDSTIRTVLRRLEEKGYLTHEIEGRTFIYKASDARQNVAVRAVRDIIDRFCGGSAEATRPRHGGQRRARSQATGTAGPKIADRRKRRRRQKRKESHDASSSTTFSVYQLLVQLGIRPPARLSSVSWLRSHWPLSREDHLPAPLHLDGRPLSALAMPLLQWMLPPLPVPAPPLPPDSNGSPCPNCAFPTSTAGIQSSRVHRASCCHRTREASLVNQCATSSGGTRTPAPAATSPTPAVPFCDC